MLSKSSILREAIRIMLESDEGQEEEGAPDDAKETALQLSMYLAAIRQKASDQSSAIKTLLDDYDNPLADEDTGTVIIGLIKDFAYTDQRYAPGLGVAPLGLLYLGAVVQSADYNNANYIIRSLYDFCLDFGGEETANESFSRKGRLTDLILEGRADDLRAALDAIFSVVKKKSESVIKATLKSIDKTALAKAVKSADMLAEIPAGTGGKPLGKLIEESLNKKLNVYDEVSSALAGDTSAFATRVRTVAGSKGMSLTTEDLLKITRDLQTSKSTQARAVEAAKSAKAAADSSTDAAAKLAAADNLADEIDKLDAISDELADAIEFSKWFSTKMRSIATDPAFVKQLAQSFYGVAIRAPSAGQKGAFALAVITAAASGSLSLYDWWKKNEVDISPGATRAIDKQAFSDAITTALEADGAEGLSAIGDAFILRYNQTTRGDALKQIAGDPNNTGDLANRLYSVIRGTVKTPVPSEG